MSTRVYFDEYGGPQVLKVGTEELPEAGEGEVRVEFRAVSVNPVDWKLVAGYLKQWAPLDFPAVPGSEAAGVVTAVGPAFEGFAVGDEVIWNGPTGGYRTEALVPAEQLTPLPAGVDFEQAACIPVAGGTTLPSSSSEWAPGTPSSSMPRPPPRASRSPDPARRH